MRDAIPKPRDLVMAEFTTIRLRLLKNRSLYHRDSRPRPSRMTHVAEAPVTPLSSSNAFGSADLISGKKAAALPRAAPPAGNVPAVTPGNHE